MAGRGLAVDDELPILDRRDEVIAPRTAWAAYPASLRKKTGKERGQARQRCSEHRPSENRRRECDRSQDASQDGHAVALAHALGEAAHQSCTHLDALRVRLLPRLLGPLCERREPLLLCLGLLARSLCPQSCVVLPDPLLAPLGLLVRDDLVLQPPLDCEQLLLERDLDVVATSLRQAPHPRLVLQLQVLDPPDALTREALSLALRLLDR